MALSWTQPTCEACWLKKNTIVGADNEFIVRRPTMVKEAELERCSYCGAPTIVGIYTRADPATVTYPREKEA
jgi:hypothetical protein